MSEEKEAIKYLEFLSNEKCECEACQRAKKEYKTILNLINKQQKEIKSLTDENNFLKEMYRGTTEYKAIKKKVEELGWN